MPAVRSRRRFSHQHPMTEGNAMNTPERSGDKVRIQVDLTDDQRAKVRETLGMDGKTMELAIEPLEERVTPIIAILIGAPK
jgi:hypothetical protein